MKNEDPSLRYYSNYVTTYRKGEGCILVEELVIGDPIRLWLKTRHYLQQVVINHKSILEHKDVSPSGSTNRGYYFTNIRGSLYQNNIQDKEMQVLVSPGALGWPHDITATAVIPWLAISRCETLRRRFDQITGLENVRSPFILPVKFLRWPIGSN